MSEQPRSSLRFLSALGLAVALLLRVVGAQDGKDLDIYFVDVEGGEAILFVTPAGESLLLDAGGDFDRKGEPLSRDADRILDVARRAGLRRLDYMWTTHYHQDHVGAVPQIAAALPIRTFVDHGELRGADVEGAAGVRLYRDYVAARSSGRHVELRAGGRLPLGGGVEFVAVASQAQPITKPLGLPGAGKPNPFCGEFVRRPEDNTLIASIRGENAASLATVMTFGRFSLVELGDLMWNQTFDLVCPKNLIGEVSVYVTPVHGLSLSGPRALVHALRPRIAVWTNGLMKGSREPIDTLRASPGLEDLWQLHYLLRRPPSASYGETVESGGPANNASDDYIANLTGKEAAGATGSPGAGAGPAPTHNTGEAAFIKITARRDGSFTVTNSRTGFTKQYGPSRKGS